jgi:hypothetical protein
MPPKVSLLQYSRENSTFLIDKETLMSARRPTLHAAAFALTAVLAAFGAQAADLPGHHPAYLHALSDLRLARWNLTHRGGDAAVAEQERIAVLEIDRAIAQAMQAAGEDGKNAERNVHEDAVLDRSGALHHAAELLAKAKQDVAEGEDNPQARRIRNGVIEHIDVALDATRHAILDVEQHR